MKLYYKDKLKTYNEIHNGRNRKYYITTTKGKKHIKDFITEWNEITNTLKALSKDIIGKERKDLLNYYEEIISDRLENHESIVAIRKSLLKDFSNNNETNLKHNNSTLFSILMIPFIIIFGLIGLA